MRAGALFASGGYPPKFEFGKTPSCDSRRLAVARLGREPYLPAGASPPVARTRAGALFASGGFPAPPRKGGKMIGTVFDIKEFSVYDGPGVRATVFLKGCPLRCQWCHNPEGLGKSPQIMISSGCKKCGKCQVSSCALIAKGECSGCSECVTLCPYGLRRISGTQYSPEALAKRLLTYAPFFGSDGGVTFSGGEPTYQPEFLCQTLDLLGNAGIHRAVQSCGYCSEPIWERVLSRVEFVLFDIKHTDSELHKKYTGADNKPILTNLERLKRSGIPFIARVPLIDGVNNSALNLRRTAELLTDAANLVRVELLPYNGAAGAKYKMVGMPFERQFRAPDSIDLSPFTRLGIECKVL